MEQIAIRELRDHASRVVHRARAHGDPPGQGAPASVVEPQHGPAGVATRVAVRLVTALAWIAYQLRPSVRAAFWG